ncbi:NADH dehydrogenase [ubiquinone] 1 alpha subcomplex subunit 12 [Cricetulus griseus]|uniref:NADH dehydrogenase [ubiquinone] 1 alpha subcomplex subunit 12 n=1 Tax=Cricetulus griseus TaxID=10029 RepID=G3HBK4_CRIGR|nr:NADH dehydrogenase [ubiquinone] 1 alpha subcomplex subunit 12 [Cricetulus griseus]
MEKKMELLQVLRRGLHQVTGHGGLRGFLKVFFRANDVKLGTLVGEDKYGNKYYEDNKQFFGECFKKKTSRSHIAVLELTLEISIVMSIFHVWKRLESAVPAQ